MTLKSENQKEIHLSCFSPVIFNYRNIFYFLPRWMSTRVVLGMNGANVAQPRWWERVGNHVVTRSIAMNRESARNFRIGTHPRVTRPAIARRKYLLRGCAKGSQGWKEPAAGERGTILNLNAFCTVQRAMRTRSYQLFFPGEASSLFRGLIEEQSFNFAEFTPPACIDRSSR